MKNIISFAYFQKRHATVQDQAAQWLIIFDQGKPSKQEFKEFLNWYRQNPKHQQAIRDLAIAWNLVTQVPVSLKPAPSSPKLWLPYAAACLLLIITLSISFNYLATKPTTDSESLLLLTQSSRDEVFIANALHVIADSNSKMDISSNQNESQIQMHYGQAYFSNLSTQHHSKLVSVHTALGNISNPDGSFTVILNDGLVQVLSMEKTTIIESYYLGQTVILQAGEKLSLSSLGLHVETLDAKQIQRDIAWLEGNLSFQQEPLSTAMGIVSRYHAIDVTFANLDLASIKINGRYVIDDLPSILTSIKTQYNISSEFDPINRSVILF